MKIIRNSFWVICILVPTLLLSCEEEYDGKVQYEAIPETPAGTKLVNNTDLIATIFSDSSYSVAPGVEATEIHYFSMSGYTMRLFIFDVDLTNPEVSLEVSTPNNESVIALQAMTLQATFEDAEGHRVWGGVNGSFFDVTSGKAHGLLYKEGSLVQLYSDGYPNFFLITKDRKAMIGSSDNYGDLKDNIYEAVGGGVMLVKNGSVINQTDVSVNPRTAIGVSADQQHVYILVADGRRYHYSNGLSYQELGHFMAALGAETAMNFDGGGSSTFFIRKSPDFSSDRFVLRNWPTDNGGVAREVANGLIITSN